MVARLERDPPAFGKDIGTMLVPYTPAGVRVDATVALVLAGTSDGWTEGGKTFYTCGAVRGLRVARLTTKRNLLLAQSDAYLDYVFNFGARLIKQLDVLLDEEHVGEKAAARIALAREERSATESEQMPRDAFNLGAPRVCPFCSRSVVIPVLSAEPPRGTRSQRRLGFGTAWHRTPAASGGACVSRG